MTLVSIGQSFIKLNFKLLKISLDIVSSSDAAPRLIPRSTSLDNLSYSDLMIDVSVAESVLSELLSTKV